MLKQIHPLIVLATTLTLIACQLFSAASSTPATETSARSSSQTPTHTPSATPTENVEPSPSTPVRQNADQPDDHSGYQVHVMYALPSDGVDRNLDTNGTLSNSVGSFQNWLRNQTGGVQLRVDTFEGRLDISFYRLARPDLAIASYREYVRDQVQNDLQTAGFN